MRREPNNRSDIRTENSIVTGRFNYHRAYERVSSNKSEAQIAAEEKRAARQAAKERSRKKKQKIFKLGGAVLALILIIVLVITLITKCSGNKKDVDERIVLETEDSYAEVTKLYTYGTHLSITGKLPAEIKDFPEAKADLVLFDQKFVSVPIVITDDEFVLSKYLNGGIYLDGITRGEYSMFIRLTSNKPFPEPEAEENNESSGGRVKDLPTNGKRKEHVDRTPTEETTEPETEAETEAEGEAKEKYYKYYPLVNKTNYKETTYYTLSNTNNKIVIGSSIEYPTMGMSVSKNTDSGIYDIVIDPGHGGKDYGSVGVDGMSERDVLLPLANKLKDQLEKAGMKVAMIRTDDKTYVDNYGPDGRAARACQTHAKYLVSLHMGSGSNSGVEIDAASNMKYDLAYALRESIKNRTHLASSTGSTNLIDDALCAKNFSQADIDETLAEYKRDGLTAYDITTDACYYFTIRETGGIATGAYADDRNGKERSNPYYNINTGIESYITKLGSINDKDDVDKMKNNMDDFARGLAEGILTIWDSNVVEEDMTAETEEEK